MSYPNDSKQVREAEAEDAIRRQADDCLIEELGLRPSVLDSRVAEGARRLASRSIYR